MIKLTNDKKKLLFEEGYVTAKTLDAAVEPGWQKYFITKFDWILNEKKDQYGFNELVLVEKTAFGDSKIEYKIGLNLEVPQGLRLSDLQ